MTPWVRGFSEGDPCGGQQPPGSDFLAEMALSRVYRALTLDFFKLEGAGRPGISSSQESHGALTRPAQDFLKRRVLRSPDQAGSGFLQARGSRPARDFLAKSPTEL